jgi:catechol 2,3-dioxygenase-like lactoylglutathione lyase family enzyme
MKIKILSLDHVAFNAADAEASLEFYAGKLGLPVLRRADFGAGRVPFPSVRVNGATIFDFFPPQFRSEASRGQRVDHVALTLANSSREIEAFLRERKIEIVREMTGNFGAQGDTAHAFHILDPDGFTLELHAYE